MCVCVFVCVCVGVLGVFILLSPAYIILATRNATIVT